MELWVMLQSIMGVNKKKIMGWVPPPPPGEQTNKVKLLPSRRTTYAGGNNYCHFCFQLLLKRRDIEELSHHNVKIADIVALEIGNVGENIAVRRAASLRADDDGHIGYYVHSSCVYSNGIPNKCETLFPSCR